ncbi:MAG: hypothetical protein ABSF44_04865 [Candidatus Bathyarchaeia archaeon]
MDAVIVKVGGSLAIHPEKLRSLCAKLAKSAKEHRLIVVPGGGEFADTVRKVDSRFSLSPQISHRMAILGTDQYGLLLSQLLANSFLTCKLEDVQEILDSGRLPVFLPSALLFSEDDLENSWDVTSDSIALYVAGRLHVPRVVLVTDVDGVYNCDPKKFSDARLIRRLSACDLLEMEKRTSVDRFLPKLLLQFKVECFVVNGLQPQRVEAILNGKKTICTLINGNPNN